jgi:hypothetical protein
VRRCPRSTSARSLRKKSSNSLLLLLRIVTAEGKLNVLPRLLLVVVLLRDRDPLRDLRRRYALGIEIAEYKLPLLLLRRPLDRDPLKDLKIAVMKFRSARVVVGCRMDRLLDRAATIPPVSLSTN